MSTVALPGRAAATLFNYSGKGYTPFSTRAACNVLVFVGLSPIRFELVLGLAFTIVPRDISYIYCICFVCTYYMHIRVAGVTRLWCV